MSALVLLLADGRFPSGGYSHSGGVEGAVAGGRLADVDELGPFLVGRLATAGRVSAALAAAACGGGHGLDLLDREASARMASPALRAASMAQGRHLLRAGAAVLGRRLPTGDAHHAVAMGIVGRAAGASVMEVARWAAYESVAGPAAAALRLLGLDPFATWALVASLDRQVEAVAAESAAAASGPLDRLPAASAPWLDIGAQHHASQEVRLFAS